jgi:RES domain-containing protein
MVYVSRSLSLAALEMLVHLPSSAPLTFSTFRLSFDDGLVEFYEKYLPDDWRTQPPGPDTQTIGDGWVREARSAILAVPSTIIPQETNFLLNPAHEDFSRIGIAPAEPFAFDPRMLRASPSNR